MDDIEFTETDSLRQGDVIQRGSGQTAQTRIVITTNCDIRFNKHREVITTVLLMKAIDYVSSFVLSEELSRYTEQLKNKIINEKNSRESEIVPIKRISEERFLEWVTEEDPTSTMRLLLAEWPVLSEYRDLLNNAQSDESMTIDQILTLIKRFRGIGIGRSDKNLQAYVDSKIKSPPGDFVFVAGGASIRDPFGYIAHLRDIAIVDESEIRLRDAWTSGPELEKEWRRIARVKDYFLHNLLQKFGLVFGSIGMPADFEAGAQASRELILEYIQGEVYE